MKKQLAPSAKAFLIRGAFYLLLLASVATTLFALGQRYNRKQNTLTFAQRVAYQRAIEEVYSRHRIWPKGNATAKPSLDAIMSQATPEKKVADYLCKSKALQDCWQNPITSEELQGEMDRMAQHTRHPAMLRELFHALGDDPFVVAECLARPILAQRVTAEPSVQLKTKGLPSPCIDGVGIASTATPLRNAVYHLPTISAEGPSCSEDTWTAITTTNAPAARASHTAIWTGSEMIVWGGYGENYLNTGGRYEASTDSWIAVSTVNAPAVRAGHTAVWTGTEMIIWGGDDGQGLNTGARYNPAADTWTPTSTINAPPGRLFHAAVWSGSEMIVWGGWSHVELNSGGRYDPHTDSWTATSTINAPTARFNHSAVWAGSEMIVWGGWNGLDHFNTGGRYNPSTDSWTATSTTAAPSGRKFHTAKWTDAEMIVWGGDDGSNLGLNSGGRYNPGTDSWMVTSSANAPAARFSHTAVWTGSDIIVWGGTNGLQQFNTGGKYNPTTDNWMPTTTTNPPEQRAYQTAVWSGSDMIVWGGLNDIAPFYLNTGGRYCAQSGVTPTPTPGKSCLVEQVTPCDTQVSIAPVDFTVQMSCSVDLVQSSGFMVNNIGPSSFEVSNNTITFHYDTSPAVPGLNTIHILFDAIFCCSGSPSNEFTCTFNYTAATPSPTPRSTPTPRPRPVPRPRP
ncbi:MAG TPA: hypothetical protein VFA51_06450 [Candidatus Udaeobacter sp.]|nr:hypothetical protein [Candidatus Udaeobacter sp.]